MGYSHFHVRINWKIAQRLTENRNISVQYCCDGVILFYLKNGFEGGIYHFIDTYIEGSAVHLRPVAYECD